MLEMAEGKTYVPPNKVGLVIGAKGSNIHDITKKTNVVCFPSQNFFFMLINSFK